MFLLFNFFPIPFIVCLLILGTMMFRSRSRGWIYLIVLAIFGFYVMAVIDVLFFPIPFSSNWPLNLTWKDTLRLFSQANLIPLINYRLLLLHPESLFSVLRDIFLNILLTIPFGWGVCYLRRPHPKYYFWIALLTGLFLEGTQLIMKLALGIFYHAVDINDVIWNGLGVLVGFGLYHAGCLIWKKIKPDT